MKIFFKYFLFLFFLFTGINPSNSKNVVKHLSNLNGLSNNSVNCILEDVDNQLWIGTWDGLNVYNGRDVKSFRYSKDNKNSLSNNVVRQIIEQDNEHLWISTDYGINLWNKKEQSFTRYFFDSDFVPKQEKSYLIGLTREKQTLAYLKDKGFFYFDKSTRSFKPIDRKKMQGFDCHITALAVNESNSLYMLCENGTVMYSQISIAANAVQFSDINRYPLSFSAEHLFYSNGKLIVSGEGNMIVIGSSSSENILTDSDLTPNSVSVKEDKIYFTVLDKGGFVYDMPSKEYTSLPELPEKTSYFSSYAGSQDILWIGTDGQGVFQCYSSENPFRTQHTNYSVRCFMETADGNILFGTKGDGINLFNKESGSVTSLATDKNGLISNSVYSFCKNKYGDIFIGTEGEGLNVYLQGSKKLSRLKLLPSHLSLKAVYCMRFTNNDSLLWVGTSGYGLIKLHIEKQGDSYFVSRFEQFRASSHPKGLNNDVVFAIEHGRVGEEIFVGTRGGGVSRLNVNTGVFESLETAFHVNLTNTDILSLLYAADKLYIGTSYGLNCLQHIPSGKIDHMVYTEAQGLQNSTIHGMLLDENGDIWASTNNGISHIAGNDVINYTYRDGLQSNEFSDGAFYIDNQGFMYFGGVNGFNYFIPKEIHFRNFKPKLRLSGLKIYNAQQNIEEMISDNVLHLPYNDRFVTLSFIASDFINNENCEYAYRLVNFSDEWVYNGDNPNIVFTKLPPGNYTLEVKCTNGDKVWSEEIYRLEMKVANPWWLSAYAIITYILFAILLILVIRSIVLNRIRLNRQIMLEHIEKQHQQKIHDSRINFFTNVAHEFFTPLTLIYGPAQHLLDNAKLDKFTTRYILQIKNNAARMQGLIQELMEFRKAESGHTVLHPENIDIRLMLNYITDNYSDIMERNGIDFDLQFSNTVSMIYSDRISLEKILFNLISNAFKYTPKNGDIRIRIDQDTTTGKLNMSIQNSGKGLTEKQLKELFNRFKVFDHTQLQNTTSTGIGLSLTKTLTELLKGEIQASSTLGEYVKFEISIPTLETKTEEGKNCTEESLLTNEDLIEREVQEKAHVNILIVEDEFNIRELLKEIISPFYNVFEAGNGREALEKINQNTPDIIISDIMMPEMDGISFISALKADNKLAHIPVIGVSAKNALEDQTMAFKHGIDLFISKPFHPKHILATIESTLLRIDRLKSYFGSSISSTTVKEGITMYQEDERLLNKLIIYIEKNLEDDTLNPNSIAETFGLSKATLYRRLKDLANATPSEFVRKIRLEHASKLLVTTNLTVTEIMFQTGFPNKSYFYREFAKMYEVSPKEYRDKVRGSEK